MKICCLVKEVPDAAVQKRIDPNTKRLDRSGEKNLNPFDTHGIEAAMQIREGGKADVGIESDRVGEAGSKTQVLAINPPPAKETGEIIEDEDTNETVERIVAWLDERKLI